MNPLDSNVTFPYSSRGSRISLATNNSTSLLRDDASRPPSLSVNYLPSKFSSALVTPGVGRRRRKGKSIELTPKRGGGREAFKNDEARMPGEGDDDYDGIDNAWFGNKAVLRVKPRMRWNRFKWILFLANVTVCRHTRHASVKCSQKI